MEHKPLEEEDEDGLDEQASLMTWNVLHAKGFETRFSQYASLPQVFARLQDVPVALFGLSPLSCIIL